MMIGVPLGSGVGGVDEKKPSAAAVAAGRPEEGPGVPVLYFTEDPIENLQIRIVFRRQPLDDGNEREFPRYSISINELLCHMWSRS